MKLGTMISKVLKPFVGERKCAGCEARARFLDNVSTRRGIIKGTFAAMALALAWPFRANALQCDCIFCPNGEQACLCCDPGCLNCRAASSGNCVLVNEWCPGEGWTTYETCCPTCPPHCPAFSNAGKPDEDNKARYLVHMDDGIKFFLTVTNPRKDFDALEFFQKRVTVKDKKGKVRHAVSVE